MQANFMTFLLMREMFRKSVPEENLNKSAVLSTLSLSGNRVAPFLWMQEKAKDEQDKQSLTEEVRELRGVSETDLGRVVEQANNSIIIRTADKTALEHNLGKSFKVKDLERMQKYAIDNKKHEISNVLKKILKKEETSKSDIAGLVTAVTDLTKTLIEQGGTKMSGSSTYATSQTKQKA